MQGNFAKALDVTLAEEGAWSDHPEDKGGPTMKGVTLATFRDYFPGATVYQLRNITSDQLQKIYRRFWDGVSGDALQSGVDLATFDYGVNSGPGVAHAALLKAIGGTNVQTVQRLCARRLSSYRTFRNWRTFGKGWAARVARIEAKGVAWALAADATPVKPALGKEAKKAAGKATAQGATAAGAGGATIAPVGSESVDAAANHIGGLALAGITAALVLLALWLGWRAYVNTQRARAYAAEKGA